MLKKTMITTIHAFVVIFMLTSVVTLTGCAKINGEKTVPTNMEALEQQSKEKLDAQSKDMENTAEKMIANKKANGNTTDVFDIQGNAKKSGNDLDGAIAELDKKGNKVYTSAFKVLIIARKYSFPVLLLFLIGGFAYGRFMGVSNLAKRQKGYYIAIGSIFIYLLIMIAPILIILYV